MAHKPTILKQHRSTLYLLAACIVVLGLVFLLTIPKDLRKRQALEADLTDTTRRADAQKLLAPLLAELQGESEASVSAMADGGDMPQPPTDISVDNYKAVIGEIVRQCGLEQTSLTPDLQSILSDTDTLRVDLAARGAFPDFRRLILALARLPFLSGIENFRIEGSADTDMLEMILQLRLQLAASGKDAHEPQ